MNTDRLKKISQNEIIGKCASSNINEDSKRIKELLAERKGCAQIVIDTDFHESSLELFDYYQNKLKEILGL